MGKAEDELNLPSTTVDAQGTGSSAGSSSGCCLGCSGFSKLVSLRCVFVLLLGFAVLLSAIFWLPIFRFGHHKDLDLDYGGHDIVASFVLRKPASFLQDHVMQLENDIFDEMSFASTKVEIVSLKPSAAPNVTKVVFAVESDVTTRSLIRASFLSMITRQSPLHLTESLFGNPFEFDVLRFKGGLTVSPEQKAFLMQNVQILFNFTLNFSIDEILVNFEELRSQLNTGLHLAPYENLYIRLTNLKGSTVIPPTTIQAQVLLAVGINASQSRLKQLAQTITGSHTKNLGLDNSVFGRVKQVSLSSVLQHSLGGDARGPATSPSPSPMPPAHHHGDHHHITVPEPTISPSPSTGHNRGSPAPAPIPIHKRAGNKKPLSPPPLPACQYGRGHTWKHNGRRHVAPSYSPDYGPTPSQSQHRRKYSPPLKRAPFYGASPPGGGHGHGHHHSHPPSRSVSRVRPSNVMPIVSSPSPSPCNLCRYLILQHTGLAAGHISCTAAFVVEQKTRSIIL
ncbi:hydroxyproline-rich glycoprotein family protein [Striga asiatica]|uniref:Hydroxyproline-rich glycoprotein family protein n=1 Tax=Striga asiatica TaxID=4170 RepID=A0A5A7R6Q6_STRAF|nr:hydroxyproline-rich glycoprotein family protein [Striga asiatica]